MSWTVDTLDILTETEARSAVSDNGTPKATDGLLNWANTVAAQRLDELCGPIVQRTITNERHDGGQQWLRLRHGPVSAFTSVTEYQRGTSVTLSAESGSTLPSSAYLADQDIVDGALYSGMLWRRAAGSPATFYPGKANIFVTYTAGRYATTADVSFRFKLATKLMLDNFWRAVTPSIGRVGEFDVPFSNFPSFAIPNVVTQLLRDDLREAPVIV